jgi:hypothetical protein
MHLLTLLFSALAGLPQAHARDDAGNFFVAPSLYYYSGLRTRSSREEKEYSVYELKAAYNFYEGFFGGLAYQLENEDRETSGFTSASLNSTSKSKRTSLGPTVGYVTPTFHALFTYFYDSKWNLTTTTSTDSAKYDYKGSGFQLDVGYKIQLWELWFGPQLSYKKFIYSKLTTDGGASESISPKLEDTGLEPSLVIFFFF